MKKYVKPELFFERYEVSRHIAACTWDLNSPIEGVCNFKGDPTQDPSLSPEYILLTENRACNFEGPYCYMNAEGGLNTFNS